ncbi:metallophosphoesterase [Caldivirga sp. UBA161]|uniref:metallophosphoesterase n=1 Tax=Caldivirga sp. UBA161 TaxID=1915569 RepID=UPI0025C71FDC|nr:metallophosphoesterase [Caldivirga sp. UBA161]
MSLTLIYVVASVAAVVLILYMLINNSPWLIDRELKMSGISINSNSMLVVSDLHVDANSSDLSVISELIRRSGVNTMVIAGDLFDRRVKVNDDELRIMLHWATQRLGLINDNGSELTLIYVRSESSHDPEIKDNEPVVIKFSNILIVTVPRAIKVNFPNCSDAVYVAHGDYTVSDGLLAGLINIAPLTLLKLPIVELITRRILNANHDDWVIIGHTHLPVISSRFKVANPGSWKGILFTNPYNGYVLIRCVNKRLIVKLSRVSSDNFY